MTKKIYLETLRSVLGRSISHYCHHNSFLFLLPLRVYLHTHSSLHSFVNKPVSCHRPLTHPGDYSNLQSPYSTRLSSFHLGTHTRNAF